MSKITFLACVCCLSLHLSAQSLVGKKIPAFDQLVWVQQPQSLKAFHPRFVVVEFWATWCSPCLANLQHLNELSSGLSQKQVAFLSVTDEHPDKITRFLQKRKINGWVACDTAKAIFQLLNIQSLPRTLIINDKGIICFDGRPEELSEEKILGAIPSLTITTPSNNCAKTGSWGPGIDPAFTVHFSMEQGLFPHQQTIRKSIGISGSGYRFNKHFSGVTLLNHSLPEMVAFCLDLQSFRRVINISTIPDSVRWDFIFSKNKQIPPEKMLEQIITVASETFNVSIQDSLVKMNIKMPYLDGTNTILNEKDIDFSAPETKTYRSLAEIYGMIETRGDMIVFSTSVDSAMYLDVFDIFNSYHNLTADELQQWLLTKGIRFEEEQKTLSLKFISDTQ